MEGQHGRKATYSCSSSTLCEIDKCVVCSNHQHRATREVMSANLSMCLTTGFQLPVKTDPAHLSKLELLTIDAFICLETPLTSLGDSKMNSPPSFCLAIGSLLHASHIGYKSLFGHASCEYWHWKYVEMREHVCWVGEYVPDSERALHIVSAVTVACFLIGDQRNVVLMLWASAAMVTTLFPIALLGFNAP